MALMRPTMLASREEHANLDGRTELCITPEHVTSPSPQRSADETPVTFRGASREKKRSRESAVAPLRLTCRHAMEDDTPSNPRELTQNPLKKIWMPCKNGLPEKHISQRKGAYDGAAAKVSIRGS